VDSVDPDRIRIPNTGSLNAACHGGGGINSKESIPPAYVAWRARTATQFVVPARQPILDGETDSLDSFLGINSWAP
jgi:hypothetical protein